MRGGSVGERVGIIRFLVPQSREGTAYNSSPSAIKGSSTIFDNDRGFTCPIVNGARFMIYLLPLRNFRRVIACRYYIRITWESSVG